MLGKGFPVRGQNTCPRTIISAILVPLMLRLWKQEGELRGPWKDKPWIFLELVLEVITYIFFFSCPKILWKIPLFIGGLVT